jgi:hypothetical protein
MNNLYDIHYYSKQYREDALHEVRKKQLVQGGCERTTRRLPNGAL